VRVDLTSEPTFGGVWTKEGMEDAAVLRAAAGPREANRADNPGMGPPRMIRILWALTVVISGCTSSQPGPSGPTPPGTTPVRVLMLTATAGFRHDSIPTAIQVMASLAASAGEFTVTATGDVASIDAGSLAAHDVLFFALTSGELPFTAAQQTAIVNFVSGGGGFLGAHSATDTLYQWPEYGAIVGAYFKEHPWTQSATVIVEDATHPATAGLGPSFALVEEFYTFQDNPRPRVQVLLRLDASSVGASGDFPLAWAQSFGTGRAYYNALGHFPATWSDPRFQSQLRGAIRWLAKRE
jgi:type 1 glutamine amidotransferase